MNKTRMRANAEKAAAQSAEMLPEVTRFNPQPALLRCIGMRSKVCLSEGGGPGHT